MKIGIISDVHGNIDALDRVWIEFENRKVEKVICLGDIIGIGPHPDKCMDFMIDHNDKIVSWVMGNHEKYLLYGIPKKAHNEDDGVELSKDEADSFNWNHSKLTNRHKEIIATLKDDDLIALENAKIYVSHYVLDREKNMKKFIKNPSVSDLIDLYNDALEAAVYLFGHTHEKVCYFDNGKFYINPGSLGCPNNSNALHAGILDIVDGNISYEQLDVEYDCEKMIEDMRNPNYPIAEHYIKLFFRN